MRARGAIVANDTDSGAGWGVERTRVTAGPLRPEGRSLSDFEPLLPAEETLLRCVRRGQPCSLTDLSNEALVRVGQALHARGELQKAFEGHIATKDDRTRAALESLTVETRLDLFNRALVDCINALPRHRLVEISDMSSVVRGAFVRFLALGGDERAPVHEYGVCLLGAHIAGDINLQGAAGVRSLTLQNCWIEGDLNLRNADGGPISLLGSRIIGIDATSARFKGGLGLCHRFVSENAIVLHGARIEGNLELNDARLAGSEEALVGDLLEIGGDLLLSDVIASGMLRFVAAKVAGHIRLGGADLSPAGASTVAIVLDGVTAGRNVTFGDSFKAGGRVLMSDARIGGELNLGNCRLGAGDFALHCQRTVIGADVVLGPEFRSHGLVNFDGCTIAGSFRGMSGSELENAPKACLALNGAKVSGDVYLGRGAVYNGRVEMRGINIGGYLECDGAHIRGGEGVALECEHARFGNSVLLRNGFRADGPLGFFNARISGSLELRNAQVWVAADPSQPKPDDLSAERLAKDRQRFAIVADNATIGNAVLINDKTSIIGHLTFTQANVGSNFIIEGASIKIVAPAIAAFTEGGRAEYLQVYGLAMSGAKVGGIFGLGMPLDGRDAVIEGSINLSGTKVGTLSDTMDSWPSETIEQDGHTVTQLVNLEGFVYDRLEMTSSVDADERAAWLGRGTFAFGQFAAQPYEQLAKVVAGMGHTDEARKIHIYKEATRRKLTLMAVRQAMGRAWRRPYQYVVLLPIMLGLMLERFVMGRLLRYGYGGPRLAIILALLWLGAGAFFDSAARQSVMVPSHAETVLQKDLQEKCKNWTSCDDIKDYTRFSPYLYSADLILSVIDLGQAGKWEPRHAPMRLEVPRVGEITLPDWMPNTVMWVTVILGTALSAFLIAVLSGLVRKE